eukprot:Polyplicarium_translucidae@DN1638_c0_g1_i3.p1
MLSNASQVFGTQQTHTMAKHKLPESNEGDERQAKKMLTESEKVLNELSDLQDRLVEIDKRCAKEQISVQKKFDEEKKPHIEERQKIIERIPQFWGTAICHHPMFQAIDSEEREMLMLLKNVELEDNIDSNGSYKLTLAFDAEAEKYFTPVTLSKHVVFGDGDDDQERVESLTEIAFKEGHEFWNRHLRAKMTMTTRTTTTTRMRMESESPALPAPRFAGGWSSARLLACHMGVVNLPPGQKIV